MRLHWISKTSNLQNANIRNVRVKMKISYMSAIGLIEGSRSWDLQLYFCWPTRGRPTTGSLSEHHLLYHKLSTTIQGYFRWRIYQSQGRPLWQLYHFEQCTQHVLYVDLIDPMHFGTTQWWETKSFIEGTFYMMTTLYTILGQFIMPSEDLHFSSASWT